MKRKALILSDSVALGRLAPERVSHEHTWPALLGHEYDVHQVSIGGGTVEDLLRQVPYHKPFEPEFVILQSGIVDCAPRFLSQFEQAFLKRIPVFGKWAMGQLNRGAVRKFRKITYSPPTRFRQCCKRIKDEMQSVPVFAIGILPAVAQYENILPGVSGNIRTYNGILSEVFGTDFVSMDDFPMDGLMSDHHHINQTGHRFIYNRVADLLKHYVELGNKGRAE